MGAMESLNGCSGTKCSTVLLLLAVLFIAATPPAAQAHSRNLLEATHASTSTDSSSNTGISSPAKPVIINLNSKHPTLPWRQQQQQQAQLGPGGIKPKGKDAKHSKEGKAMQSGFGNGQPKAKNLPKALHMEQPFQGLDSHGPYPDVPVPAAGQQPAYQKLGNVPKDLPEGLMAAPMKNLQVPSHDALHGSGIRLKPDMQHGKHRPEVDHQAPKGDKLPAQIHGPRPDHQKQHDNSELHRDIHAQGEKMQGTAGSHLPSMPKIADMPNPGMPQPIFKLRHGQTLQPELSGPASQQNFKVVDQIDLEAARRNLLQTGDGKTTDQKHKMPEGAVANPGSTSPHEYATSDLQLDKQHAGGKYKLKKPAGPTCPGVQGALGNPSIPPTGELLTDPKLITKQHNTHHHGDGDNSDNHSIAKPVHMQPGNPSHGLSSLGNPSMRSPGYTVALAEQQHEQYHHAGDGHRGSTGNKAMHTNLKSSKPGRELPPPLQNPSTPPRPAFTPDETQQLEPSKSRNGMHVPMHNYQPHHGRNLLTVDATGSSTPPQELPAADSALTAESESLVVKASQPPAAASTDTKTGKKGSLLGDRVTYVKSASGLPAVKIDFRSKAAREKLPNPDAASGTEVGKRTGSPNANLLEGFEPMPIIDPGMHAAILSGPSGMAGQWGPAWGR